MACPFTGTYYNDTTSSVPQTFNWTTDHWSRIQNAHGAGGLDDFPDWMTPIAGTFNVEVNNVPEFDDTYRVNARAAGQALGGGFASGEDFLINGNYFHPGPRVYSVDGNVLTENGALYFPGNEVAWVNDNTPPAVNRNALHIVANTSLETLTGAAAGDSVNIELRGGDCGAFTNGFSDGYDADNILVNP